MIQVYIADDHQLIREGLKKVLKGESGISVAGDTGNPDEILPFLDSHDTDVVVLDLNFPSRSGLEILKDIKSIHPEVAVLILSMHPEEHYAVRALKAGASGYLTKESDPEELLAAIRKAGAGGKYISQPLAEKLAFDLDLTLGKVSHQMLSDREFEVMILMAKGKPQNEIASDLNLSPSTVNTYRARILEKMGFKSNAELVQYAVKNKLIE
ncbi:MAG: response regulator transcription factor [Ignavibacteriales bacterium]|nr:MAG: response regulator transcription factor [Ignavibacteriales bacterium]